MKVPLGFSFSGINAGIKASRKDLALVLSDAPCAAAGCFTTNRVRAAPILDLEGRLPAADVRAVLLNSGNANALTGPSGLEDVRTLRSAAAQALKIAPEAVLSASTGVIGMRLPIPKLVSAIPQLVKNLRPEPEAAAEAIMTTDTRVKMASRSLTIGGKEVTLAALCKGSGMIAPQLATALAVIVTDCHVQPEALSGALRAAMRTSFNSLVVDGDMSTNDSVLALANGRAGNPPLGDPGEDLDRFTAALTELCEELAREIAADGEGATKLVQVVVSGAPRWEMAHDLARAIAGSALVKAAIFGSDPNWGRVLATVGARVGSQGYEVDPYRARVVIQDVGVYAGEPLPYDASALRAKMRSPEVRIEVDLQSGPERASVYGCDLSYDYVKINADYSSLIVQTPGGSVVKDDRLSNYSPSFKVSLLVEALSYISRFSGKRCVIKYGGAAMVKESLKRSFCDDINLLRSVGLQPIVVHGGGPEITKTLTKLGKKTEFVDGVRVTDASDLKVVEMVLTGAVNTELVTLLNRNGGVAVGLSGKDGALLRARKRVSGKGRDLGQVGDITGVNKAFLEMLLQQNYVPIISPIAIGDDGQSYNVGADAVAAEVAVAIGASKLIFLTNVAGILDRGELVTDLTGKMLEQMLQTGSISGGMRVKVESILRALAGGVERVHVLDGRTPHSVIAELFTDRGVGSLVTC